MKLNFTFSKFGDKCTKIQKISIRKKYSIIKIKIIKQQLDKKYVMKKLMNNKVNETNR